LGKVQNNRIQLFGISFTGKKIGKLKLTIFYLQVKININMAYRCYFCFVVSVLFLSELISKHQKPKL